MDGQIRKTWDKTAIPLYLAVAVVLSMGCGYSISAAQNRQAMVDQAEIASKERASLRRAHKAEVKDLTARNTFLTEQITLLAKGSNAATKAAIESKEVK